MVFYFTGTGNTRWAASQIAEALGEELLYIPDLMRQSRYHFTLQQDERIGFCFPTHGWQPPRLVREFIRQLSVETSAKADPYCWALTTCGDNMGEAMTILNRDLALRGLKAASVFALVMPESNVCFSFLHLDSPEKARQKIAIAASQLPDMIDIIRRRQRGVSRLVKGSIPWTYSYVIGGYYNKHLITDSKFWVDKDACVACGLCAKVCPVDDIAGTPPRWLANGRCTNCLSCYHHCPQHAIHWGKMKRGQYLFKSSTITK